MARMLLATAAPAQPHLLVCGRHGRVLAGAATLLLHSTAWCGALLRSLGCCWCSRVLRGTPGPRYLTLRSRAAQPTSIPADPLPLPRPRPLRSALPPRRQHVRAQPAL